MSDLNDEQLAAQFEELGLEKKKVQEILKNKKVSTALAEIIAELPESKSSNSTLLHSFAALSKDTPEELKKYRNLVTLAIADGRLKTSLQLDGRLER